MTRKSFLSSLDTDKLRSLWQLNHDILTLIKQDLHSYNGYAQSEKISTIRAYKNLLLQEQAAITSIIETRMI